MPDLICDTSPIQYLHHLELLHILPLFGTVIVPSAVVEEIQIGSQVGANVPDLANLNWITVKKPISNVATPLITNLGPGETEALMLALEIENTVLILDDSLARQVAHSLDLQFTGTLGILLDAKKTGHLKRVRPMLDRLHNLGFHLDQNTYQMILRLAGE